MDFSFKTKHLLELYQDGCSKKIKVPKRVAKAFVERVNRIEAAVDINDLRVPPSMNFEKMQGYKNRFSIRINQQYRLEFEIDFEDEERTRGEVLIADVSKHYE